VACLCVIDGRTDGRRPHRSLVFFRCAPRGRAAAPSAADSCTSRVASGGRREPSYRATRPSTRRTQASSRPTPLTDPAAAGGLSRCYVDLPPPRTSTSRPQPGIRTRTDAPSRCYFRSLSSSSSPGQFVRRRVRTFAPPRKQPSWTGL